METKIFDYGMNGEGVGKVDGKVVLVNNALIDEVVDVEIVEDFKNYSTATINNIIKQSQNRTVPICPYYTDCGGCQLQHMKYSEQLKFKTLNVQKTIKKITGLDVHVNETIPCSTPFGYRNKMSYSVSGSTCGLMQSNSNNIVDINSCPLSDEDINKVLYIFKDYINTYKLNCIKNLVVRSIEKQILVGVVTTKHVDLKNFFSTLSENFVDIGLYEIINTRKDSVVLSGKINHIAGIKEIKIDNLGVKYTVDLMGFHQTNLEIQNKLYQHVLNLISHEDIVVNGFSGQGLLTAILAQKAKNVTGIEINQFSHKSAEMLKSSNNIKNMTNICGDFFKHIKKEKQKANTIILDPTKKGCGQQVMNEIRGIENIIYISCNPIALCKDLNVIKDDYEIEQITPYDMFPNTTSVETVVKLKRKK